MPVQLTTEPQKVLWEILKNIFGDKVRLTSGTRTKEENIRVRGAPSSRHLIGMALDVAYHPEIERRLNEIKEEARKRGLDIRTEIVRPGEKSRYGTGPHIHFSIYEIPKLEVTAGTMTFPAPRSATKGTKIAKETKIESIASRVLLGQLPMTSPSVRVPTLRAILEGVPFDTGLVNFAALAPNVRDWLSKTFYTEAEKIRKDPIGVFRESVKHGLVSPEFYAAKAMTRLGFKHLRPLHILSLAANPIAVRINGKEVHPAELLRPGRQSAQTLERFLDDFVKKWKDVRSVSDIERLPPAKRKEFVEDFSLLWVLGNRDVGTALSAINLQLWKKIDQVRQQFSPFGPISQFAAGVALGSLEAVGLSPLFERIRIQAPAAMLPGEREAAAKVGRAVGAAVAIAAPAAAGERITTGIAQRIFQRRLTQSLEQVIGQTLPHTTPYAAKEAAKLIAPQVAKAWVETTLPGRLTAGTAMGLTTAAVREPTLLATISEIPIPQVQRSIRESFPKRVLADATFFGLAHTLVRPFEFLTRKPITEAGFRVAAYLENRGANRFADIIRGTTLRIADAVANAPSFFAASEVSRRIWGIPLELQDSVEAGIFGAALGAILGGRYKTELERLRAQDPTRIRTLEEQLRPLAQQLLADSQFQFVDQTGRATQTFDPAKLIINYFREANNRPIEEAVVLWEQIRHYGSYLSQQVPSPQREVLLGFFAFDNPFAANAWLGYVLNPLFIGAARPTYPTPTRPPRPTPQPRALPAPTEPPTPPTPPTEPPTPPTPPAKPPTPTTEPTAPSVTPTPPPTPAEPAIESPVERSQLLDALARQLTRAQRARERNLSEVEQAAFNQAAQIRQQLGELSPADRHMLDTLTETYRERWRLATPDELREDKLPIPTPEMPIPERSAPTEAPPEAAVATVEAPQTLKALLPPESPLARRDAPSLPNFRRLDPEVAETIIATYVTSKAQRPTSAQEVFNDLAGEPKLAGKPFDRRDLAHFIFNNWDWLVVNYKQTPQTQEALPTPPESPTPAPAPPPAEPTVAPLAISLLQHVPVIDFSQRPPKSKRQQIINDLFPEVYEAAEEEGRDPERIEPLSKLADEDRVILEHEAVKPENVARVIQEAESAGLQWQAVRVLHPRFGERYHIFVFTPETPSELVQRAIQLRTSDIAGVDLSLADHVELGGLMNQDVRQFLMDVKEHAQKLGAVEVIEEAERLLAEIEQEEEQLRDDLQREAVNFFREQVRSIIPDAVHDIEQPGKLLEYVIVSPQGRAWRDRTTGMFIGPVVRDRSELEEIIDATLLDEALEKAAEDERFRYAHRANVSNEGLVTGVILRPDEMPDKVPLDALYFGLRKIAQERFGTEDIGVTPETIWSIGARLRHIQPTKTPAPVTLPPLDLSGMKAISPEDVRKWQELRQTLRVYHVTIDAEGWEQTRQWHPVISALGQGEERSIWAVTNRASAEYLARTIEDIRRMAKTLPPETKNLSTPELHRWISRNYPELYKKLVEVQYYGDPRQIRSVGIVELNVPMDPSYTVVPLGRFQQGEGDIGFAQLDPVAQRMSDFGWRAENFGAYSVAIRPHVPVEVERIHRISPKEAEVIPTEKPPETPTEELRPIQVQPVEPPEPKEVSPIEETPLPSPTKELTAADLAQPQILREVVRRSMEVAFELPKDQWEINRLTRVLSSVLKISPDEPLLYDIAWDVLEALFAKAVALGELDSQQAEEMLGRRRRSVFSQSLVRHKQFSTPFPIGDAVHSIFELFQQGGMQFPDELVVLEPQAGTGNLVATLTEVSGTKLIWVLNELDPKRVEILKVLFAQEDMQQLFNIAAIFEGDSLRLHGKAGMIVMNPPWQSITKGRVRHALLPFKEENLAEIFTYFAFKNNLEENGLLIAILPGRRLPVDEWFEQNARYILEVSFDGSFYKHRGTSTAARVIVVQKAPPLNIPPSKMVVPPGEVPSSGYFYNRLLRILDKDEWLERFSELDPIPSGVAEFTIEEGEAHELPVGREERTTVEEPRPTVAIPERPQPTATVEGLREPERPRGVPGVGVVGRPGGPELGPPAPSPADVGLGREPTSLGEEPAEFRTAGPRVSGRPEEVGLEEGLPTTPSVSGIPSGMESSSEVTGEGLRGGYTGTAGAVYGTREPTGLEPVVAAPERRTVGTGRPTEQTEGVGRVPEGLAEPARRPESAIGDRTWDQSGGRVAQYQPRVTVVGNTRVPTAQEALGRIVVEYAELAGAPMPDLSQVQFSPLMEDIVRRNLLVAEQVDAVALILHAYERGHGAIIADDVGLGKSRIMGAAAFELIQKGAKRIVVISHNEQVVEQIRKEFAALIEGRQEGSQVVYERTEEIEAMNRVADFVLKNGVHLINIHKLKAEQKVKGDEFDQVKLPPDGVPQVIFVQSASSKQIPHIFKFLQRLHIDAVLVDESHDYKNFDEGILTGERIHGDKGAQRANAFIDLQRKLLAKGTQFFYFSATPAQDPEDFSIYLGLRLWRHPQDFAAWWASMTHLALTGRGAYRKEQEVRWLTQLMRELKIKGYYLARDLWRGGAEFELRPEMKLADLPPEDTAILSDRRVVIAEIANYWNDVMEVVRKQRGVTPVWAKMNVRSMLQFDLKRLEAYLRRHEVFRVIDEALQKGEQVVVFTEFVGEEAETSYLQAAINLLPTSIEKRDARGEKSKVPVEGAEERLKELRELVNKLPRIPSIVDLIINRYGRQRVANLTGYETSAPSRIHEQNEFQAGKRDIAIISKTGTHGINLHDVNGRRRVMIFLDVPWSAIDFKQILGRVDRYGQKSSPRIIVIPLENPLEKKLLGTIAQRLASLGVLSKGTEQLQIVEGMEKYDLNDPTLKTILRALAEAGAFDPFSDELRNLSKEARSENAKAFYLSTSLLPPEQQIQIIDLIDQQLTNLQVDLSQQGLIIERGIARTIARISDLRDDNLPLEVLHIRSGIGTQHILIRGVFLDRWANIQRLIEMHNLRPSMGVFRLENGEVASGVSVPYSVSLWDAILRTLGRPTELTHDQLIESLKDGLDIILQIFAGPKQMRVRIQRRYYPSLKQHAWVLTVFDEQSATFRDPNAAEMRAIYESAEGHAFTHDPRIDKFVIKGVHTPTDFDRPEVRSEISQALTLLRARTSLASQPIEEPRPSWHRGGFILNPFSWLMRHFGKRSPRSKKVPAADAILQQVVFDSQFKTSLIDFVKSLGDQAIYFFVDHMWGITKTAATARRIAAKFNINIPISLDPDVAYDEFLASVTLARMFVRDYFVPWWKDIVQSGEVENVIAYLVAMHALELNEAGIESGFSDQDALSVIDEIENHWNNAGIFTEMIDRVKAFVKMNNMLLDMLHEEGIISDKAYNEALTKWQFYVPFRRWIEEAEAHGLAPPGASNFDVRGQNVFMPIKGSQRKIINPIEVFLNKVLHVHRIVYRNRVPRRMIEMVEFLAKALEKVASNMGVQPEDLPEWDFIRGFEKLPIVARRVESREGKEVVYIRRPEGRNIIHFFRDGKIESWRVPPFVAATLKQIDLQIPTVWSQLMALPARLIRVAATSWRINWILFNLVRDQFYAWFNIPGVSTYIPFVTAIWFWMRVALGEQKARRALERFFRAAAHTYTFFNEYQDEIEQYLREFERLGLKPSQPAVIRFAQTVGKLVLLPVKLPVEIGELLGQWSEFFTRISAFARVLEITGDEQLAAKIAREIPNYRRHGVIPLLAFAPFVNARIQAIRQILRTMFVARPPVQPPPPPTQPPSGAAAPSPGDRPWGHLTINSDAAAKAFFLMLLGFIIYALFNRDRKGFWDLVSNARYAFAYDIPVFIFSDDDRYIRFPIDESLKIFVVLGMLAGMAIDSEDPQAMKNLAKTLFGSTIAIVSTEDLIPAFARGAVEIATGFELFTGRRIVPESLEVFPPELQYTRRTTEFFRWLGQRVGISPAMLQTLFETHIPAVSEWTVWLTPQQIAESAKAFFEGTPQPEGAVPPRLIPIIGRFVGRVEMTLPPKREEIEATVVERALEATRMGPQVGAEIIERRYWAQAGLQPISKEERPAELERLRRLKERDPQRYRLAARAMAVRRLRDLLNLARENALQPDRDKQVRLYNLFKDTTNWLQEAGIIDEQGRVRRQDLIDLIISINPQFGFVYRTVIDAPQSAEVRALRLKELAKRDKDLFRMVIGAGLIAGHRESIASALKIWMQKDPQSFNEAVQASAGQ